ncbi:MAG: hypothetical protein K9K82_09310 [Desulfobacteraceae bacterium]|nr:hypothetical protein [Desulfobacteraceae bacterium]
MKKGKFKEIKKEAVMDAKQAILKVDSMMGEFGEQVEKMAWCREILEDAVNAGGRTGERMGEKTREMGLAFILSDVENAYEKFKADLHNLFEEVGGPEAAE